MKHFTIGGVPEHFNLPWYFTLRDKKYTKEGINLRWKDFYGGTGEMCTALRNKEIDMAVILTEGIIRDIIKGNECKIVQVYIQSPLIWGIHVASNSNYRLVEDLKGNSAAISRFGSGSHLMAYVHAEQMNWNIETDLKFEVIKDLSGALKQLPNGNGDYFMWEKFTTKPFVDDNTLRLVGECPTPWPCFVIAVRNEVLENEKDCIKTILKIINKTTLNFKNTPSLPQLIAERYDQKLEDVEQWLALTEWSQNQISEKKVKEIQNKLLKLKLISSTIPKEDIIHRLL